MLSRISTTANYNFISCNTVQSTRALRGRRMWWWGRADEIFRFLLKIWVRLYISKLKKVLFLGKSWVMPGNVFDTYVKSNSCGFFNLWKDSGCLSYLGCYRLPCLTKGNRMSSKLHLFLRIFFQFISTAVLEPVSAILLCTENFISDRWLNR